MVKTSVSSLNLLSNSYFLASFGTFLAIAGLIVFVDCSTPYLALGFLMLFGLTSAGMISGSYTASLCIAPEFSGMIESMSAFLGTCAYILSSATAGLINKTVRFRSFFEILKMLFDHDFLGVSFRMGLDLCR